MLYQTMFLKYFSYLLSIQTKFVFFPLKLSAWSRALEKPTVRELVTKFYADYGDPKVHCLVHNSSPPVAIPSQINSVNATQFYCFRSILILSSHLRLSLKWSLSLRFPHQNPVYTCPLPHTCHMPHLSPFFNRYNNWRRVHIVKGARGGVVVKALRYKPTGRGFDSRWCNWNFSVT